jgi:hypothetical protein
LRVRSKGAAHVGSLLPFEAKPAQVVHHGLAEMGLRAVRIKILVTQDQLSLGCERALLCDPERARVAQVQETCGRGCEPASVGTGNHLGIFLCHGITRPRGFHIWRNRELSGQFPKSAGAGCWANAPEAQRMSARTDRKHLRGGRAHSRSLGFARDDKSKSGAVLSSVACG